MKKNYIVKIALMFALVAVVAGIYTFIVIPSVRKDMQRKFNKQLEASMNSYRSVLVYVGNTPLLEGSVITEYNKNNFEVIEMPKAALTADYVSDFTDIIGSKVEYTICKGQQVSYSNFTEFHHTTSNDERLKEFKIAGLVARHAQIGNYIDVIVCYEDGYDIVVPKVQLYDIALNKEDGNYQQDKEGMYTIVIAVNETEYNDLVHAEKDGILDIRIYLDENQEPSEKTYYHIEY
ncbi:MAG: hypothetical protein E7385_07695 [Ruminococcaceae bacterium]|nr:hypothetical protein [Oscillospiraceae bacterium]